jgi:hypothetical protein
MGRPSRLLSKQMLAAYGPLQGGLRLEHYTLPQLLRIIQHHCTRLQGTTALELHETTLDEVLPRMTPQCDLDPSVDPLDQMLLRAQERAQVQEALGPLLQRQHLQLFTALPAAFPHLQSLALRNGLRDCCTRYADLELLAPLGSSLTALTVCMANARCNDIGPNPLPSPPGSWPFTALRRLDVKFGADMRCLPPEVGAHWLGCLALTPHLVNLDLRCKLDDEPISASQWLPGLARAAPHLTSLGLYATAIEWDAGALEALQRGLPALKELALSLFTHPDIDPEPLGEVFAALAVRTGLASLALHCSLEGDELLEPVPAALQVSDWKLDLRCKYAKGVGRTAGVLLEALQAQTALTCLEITCSEQFIDPAAFVLHHSLLALPRTLRKLTVQCGSGNPRDLDAARLMEGVAAQPQLEELHLRECEVTQWPEGATARLSSLARLRALRLWSCRVPGSFLEAAAALTQLRVLEMVELEEPDGDFHHEALWHLQRLQQLTRLQLVCASYLEGPGLAVLRHMGALQELQLELKDGVLQNLARWLLPLPPQLRSLAVSLPLSSTKGRPDAAVLAAAKLQGCVVTGDSRYPRTFAYPCWVP